MFQFLQRNSRFNAILFFLIIVLLWGGNLLNPHFTPRYYDTVPMMLYKPLVLIQNWSVLAGQLITLLFVGVNAILLAKANNDVRLIEKRSAFHILLYIILSASMQEFRQLNPMQPALTFIILALMWLFRIYKQEHDLKTIFECGVLFSIASLFYAPAILFAVLVFVGLIVLTSFNLRQWISGIVGLCLPYIIVVSLAFCFNSLENVREVIRFNLFTPHQEPFNELIPIGFSCYLALLFVLSVAYAFAGNLKKVSIRKYYLILIFFLAIVLGSYLTMSCLDYSFLFFGLLPITIYVTNYMINIRRNFWAEVLFLIILVFAVLVQVLADVPIPTL